MITMAGNKNDIETDLESLKNTWTPKQKENWEEHGAPKFERLDELAELADERDVDLDVDVAKEWYLRTYRPKKRGDGMMERDHVKVGQPERYFIKFMQKLNRPRMSIRSLMMEAPFLGEETRNEVEDAATAMVASRGMKDSVSKQVLAGKLQEHDHILQLYGIDGVEAEA